MTQKRHYEAVILIHPDYVSNIPQTIESYTKMLEKNNGVVHRSEDWGKKTLSYIISDVRKANYLLFNFETTPEMQEEFKKSLDFNDAVIRKLIRVVKKAETASTAMLALAKDEQANLKQIAFRYPKNYMNVPWMKSNIHEIGSILPSRTTELCSRQQKTLSKSIKLARFLALIPYCDRHR